MDAGGIPPAFMTEERPSFPTTICAPLPGAQMERKLQGRFTPASTPLLVRQLLHSNIYATRRAGT